MFMLFYSDLFDRTIRFLTIFYYLNLHCSSPLTLDVLDCWLWRYIFCDGGVGKAARLLLGFHCHLNDRRVNTLDAVIVSGTILLAWLIPLSRGQYIKIHILVEQSQSQNK